MAPVLLLVGVTQAGMSTHRIEGTCGGERDTGLAFSVLRNSPFL